MTRIWYCPTCGYEVDRGGRCHNCREPLVATDLTELAEGEVDDEVGYRLDDWEDEVRGALIESLVDHEIRHRFEGDELVVSADDEAKVDAIVADVSGGTLADRTEDGEEAGEEAGEPDEATLAALEALLDAASRLRVDPTDMNADGDLAEASAAIFAIEDPYGVDPATWPAVSRVTRRLLGALGADEALEDVIATQAAILCRLVEPVVGRADGAGEASEREASDRQAGEADAGPNGDDRDEVVYELDDWLPEERAELGLLLERDGIPYGWEGTDLIVSDADEDRVEPLLDEVDHDAGILVGAPEGGDDEEEYQVLSDLFGAADRLAGDPEDRSKRRDVVDAAGEVADWPTPIGMTDEQWWQVRSRVRAVSESIDEGAEPDVVASNAASLSELLRGFL
jgi:hypothetical protein